MQRERFAAPATRSRSTVLVTPLGENGKLLTHLIEFEMHLFDLAGRRYTWVAPVVTQAVGRFDVITL